MNKILSCLFLLVAVFAFSACGAGASGYAEDVAKEVPAIYVDFEIIEHDRVNGWAVLYDKNTKVMYVILDGYQSTCMTPILNADSTPKLYEGD